MRSLPLLLLLLAGCPSYQYLEVDVASGGRPLRGAIATAVCGEYDGAAARTNAEGAARLQLRDKTRSKPCSVTVASPGHDTARFDVDRFCENKECLPVEVELAGGAR